MASIYTQKHICIYKITFFCTPWKKIQILPSYTLTNIHTNSTARRAVQEAINHLMAIVRSEVDLQRNSSRSGMGSKYLVIKTANFYLQIEKENNRVWNKVWKRKLYLLNFICVLPPPLPPHFWYITAARPIAEWEMGEWMWVLLTKTYVPLT